MLLHGCSATKGTTMNEKITHLLAQMAALEDELRSAVHEQESRMFFTIKGKRVEFERTVKDAHYKLKKNVSSGW